MWRRRPRAEQHVTLEAHHGDTHQWLLAAQEAKRKTWNRLPSELQKQPTPQTPWLQTSGLHTCKRRHSCCFKPRGLCHWRQRGETDNPVTASRLGRRAWKFFHMNSKGKVGFCLSLSLFLGDLPSLFQHVFSLPWSGPSHEVPGIVVLRGEGHLLALAFPQQPPAALIHCWWTGWLSLVGSWVFVVICYLDLSGAFRLDIAEEWMEWRSQNFHSCSNVSPFRQKPYKKNSDFCSL